MTRMEKGISNRLYDNGYLMTHEFKVEVGKEGWENIDQYLINVSFSEFLEGNDLQLTFLESKDLDVFTFFIDWIAKEKSYDVVVWLGSGRRGLLFTGCSVKGMHIDDFTVYDEERIQKISVELSYVRIFVIDKEKVERYAVG